MESIFLAIGFGLGYAIAWFVFGDTQEEMKKQWKEYEKLTDTEEE